MFWSKSVVNGICQSGRPSDKPTATMWRCDCVMTWGIPENRATIGEA
jgi:hypothetical protein